MTHKNRLAQETSPYLRQHEQNPVDWYAWGEEALERARREGKPILLSVGYSACHWCHVMAHECFENEAIARQMNENFINIKVDREERPDLDQVYQPVAQMLTQGGGWPLTVFLTPDLKPFFGGTYFPPVDKFGRPGFPRLLDALSRAFREKPEAVEEDAKKLTEALSQMDELPARPAGGVLSIARAREAADRLAKAIDWTHGGLGGAPKFPNVSSFSFLWRAGTVTKGMVPQDAVYLSLRKMAQGGIYDHLGGGFHRYAVDDHWAVPHFEKMLYDNGQLLRLYSEVLLTPDELRSPQLQATDRVLFVDVIRETVAYLIREMRAPEGAFYAAQDADSEGEEGKFFVWDPTEVSEVLSPEEARAFNLRYGVNEAGNFEGAKTVLYQAQSIASVAEQTGETLAIVTERLARAREKLFSERLKRIAPGRDDKILTSWNGLAISGLMWASTALAAAGDRKAADEARAAAEGAFEFIVRSCLGAGERLFSTYQAGQPRHAGYLDDYAFLAMAALDLARFEKNREKTAIYLRHARAWCEVMCEQFSDPTALGFFFTAADHEKLIHRPKSLQDQAIPSGTSIALTVMSALAELDPEGSGKIGELAHRQMAELFPRFEAHPWGHGELLSAGLEQAVGPIVISGASGDRDYAHAYLYAKEPGNRETLICHRRTCGLPQSDAKLVRAELLQKLRPM